MARTKQAARREAKAPKPPRRQKCPFKVSHTDGFEPDVEDPVDISGFSERDACTSLLAMLGKNDGSTDSETSVGNVNASLLCAILKKFDCSIAVQAMGLRVAATLKKHEGKRKVADVLADVFLRLRRLGPDIAVQWLELVWMRSNAAKDKIDGTVDADGRVALLMRPPNPTIVVLFKRRFSSCFLVAIADFLRLIGTRQDTRLLEMAIAVCKATTWWRSRPKDDNDGTVSVVSSSGRTKKNNHYPSPDSHNGVLCGQVNDLVTAARIELVSGDVSKI